MIKKAIIVILIIAVAGFLWYRSHVPKNKIIQTVNKPTETAINPPQTDQSVVDDSSSLADASSDETDTAQADFNALCEKGEWMKIVDLSGEMTTASGKLRKVYPDEEASKEFQNYPYFLEGSEKMALTGKDQTKIDNFEDREVEVQGAKATDGKSLEISQIRCAGSETDQTVISQRNKALAYIAKNISSIAPEKPPYQKWVVDSAIILDENDFYVDYYDTIEDSDNSEPNLDTMHRVLLEISPKDGVNFGVKVAAYYVPGEEDLALKQGIDKFKNMDETTFPSYTYDSEENSWTRD